MIDWYSIEYLYPSSFKKFTNIMFPNVGVLSLSTLEFYDTKTDSLQQKNIWHEINSTEKAKWIDTIKSHSQIYEVYKQSLSV